MTFPSSSPEQVKGIVAGLHQGSNPESLALDVLTGVLLQFSSHLTSRGFQPGAQPEAALSIPKIMQPAAGQRPVPDGSGS